MCAQSHHLSVCVKMLTFAYRADRTCADRSARQSICAYCRASACAAIGPFEPNPGRPLPVQSAGRRAAPVMRGGAPSPATARRAGHQLLTDRPIIQSDGRQLNAGVTSAARPCGVSNAARSKSAVTRSFSPPRRGSPRHRREAEYTVQAASLPEQTASLPEGELSEQRDVVGAPGLVGEARVVARLHLQLVR